MKLSVILPSIRPERLAAWFDSFTKSYESAFELIIVSPFTPSYSLFGNIKWIQDWGSPVRCQQIGLTHATGNLIHRAVDDSLYLPGEMDKAVAMMTDDKKRVVAPKYTETNASVDRTHKDFQDMNNPAFYFIAYHNLATNPRFRPDWKLLNFGIIHEDMLMEVGGWDCQFESVAIAELDLAVRLQMAGAHIVLTENIAIECDWMPGHEGDHGPMHDAFEPDMEKYRALYAPDAPERTPAVPLDNWRQAPAKWERRFGK